MVFKIGEVLSPGVAQALIRRGESSGGGAFIRRDPTVRETSFDDSGRVRAQLALLREERLRDQAAQREARASRGEEFAREKFDFERGESKADREDRRRAAEQDSRNLDLREAEALQERRREAARVMQQIGSLLRNARKPNPDTGQPDPDAVRDAQQVARALFQQMMSMDLPESDKQAIREQLRTSLAATPAARAPGAPAMGGGQGGGIQLQPGAGAVDSSLARELQLPTRTP